MAQWKSTGDVFFVFMVFCSMITIYLFMYLFCFSCFFVTFAKSIAEFAA